MTDAEKAAILDWLLEPQGRRDDRNKRIERNQSRNVSTMMWAFHVWGTKEEFIKTAQEQMNAAVLHG